MTTQYKEMTELAQAILKTCDIKVNMSKCIRECIRSGDLGYLEDTIIDMMVAERDDGIASIRVLIQNACVKLEIPKMFYVENEHGDMVWVNVESRGSKLSPLRQAGDKVLGNFKELLIADKLTREQIADIQAILNK